MNSPEPTPRPPAEPAPDPREFRLYFGLLAGFLPFVLGIYVVLVCVVGSLPDLVSPKDRKTLFGLFLKELPRNLDYQKGLYGHMFTRAQEAKSTRDVDILFIGSSHAYRSFDPRLFAEAGLTTFNLGSSQQTHLQTHVLLKRYLDPLNPKIVFYEVYPAIFAASSVESALDLIANDRNDLESIRMALQINHLKVYNALIYALYRDLFQLDTDFKEPRKRGADTYIPGGYLQKKLAYYTPSNKPQRRKGWRQRPEQVEAFEQNLAMIRARGSRVILIQVPWPKSQYRLYIHRKKYDVQMQSYGEYYNYMTLLELDEHRHFYDKGHMNQDGVKLFNEDLIRRLSLESIGTNGSPGQTTLPADSP